MIQNPFKSRWIIAPAGVTCLAFGLASAAQAEDEAWYFGANLPLMFIDDTDSTASGSFRQAQQTPQGPVQHTVGYTATVATEHDTGFKLAGVLGRQFGSGLRVEGEVFLARAKVSKLTHSKHHGAGAFGHPSGRTTYPRVGYGRSARCHAKRLVRLRYRRCLDTLYRRRPRPHPHRRDDLRYDTGAVAEAVANALAQSQAPPGTPPELVPRIDLPEGTVPELSATDTAFAYQIGAGVGYTLSDTTTLQIGYRLQMVNGLSFSGENAEAMVSSDTDLRIHFLEIGIRYRF